MWMLQLQLSVLCLNTAVLLAGAVVLGLLLPTLVGDRQAESRLLLACVQLGDLGLTLFSFTQHVEQG